MRRKKRQIELQTLAAKRIKTIVTSIKRYFRYTFNHYQLNDHFHDFRKKLASPFSFKMFLLTKVPAAFFAGVQLNKLTPKEAVVSVSYKWFNTNPFGSIYFAVLSMAAEATTGILCMSALYKRNPKVSMLIIKNEGFFYKKATGRIFFTCTDADQIVFAVEQAVQTGEGITIDCNSKGLNEAGELVAEFNFTWSFKAKKQTI